MTYDGVVTYFNGVMIDIETFGTVPGCAIRSVGAARFDVTNGKVCDTFYRNVTDASNVQMGMHFDPETVEWWKRQHADAQEILSKGQVHLTVALYDLAAFFTALDIPGDDYTMVWSHGSSFDLPVLDVVYRQCGMRSPWRYDATRDTRTMRHLNRVLGYADHVDEFVGVRHYALDDALHQVKEMAYCYANVIGNRRKA